MDYAAFIGISSFICGVAVMFAIHRVVFDHYASQAEDYIEELKRQIKELTYGKQYRVLKEVDRNNVCVTYEEHHVFATPDDVLDLKFNDYLED